MVRKHDINAECLSSTQCWAWTNTKNETCSKSLYKSHLLMYTRNACTQWRKEKSQKRIKNKCPAWIRLQQEVSTSSISVYFLIQPLSIHQRKLGAEWGLWLTLLLEELCFCGGGAGSRLGLREPSLLSLSLSRLSLTGRQGEVRGQPHTDRQAEHICHTAKHCTWMCALWDYLLPTWSFRLVSLSKSTWFSFDGDLNLQTNKDETKKSQKQSVSVSGTSILRHVIFL